MGKEHKILHLEADLRGAYCDEEEGNVILDAVEKAGLLQEHLLFCGYDGSREFNLKHFFAGNTEDLLGEPHKYGHKTPQEYAFDTQVPAIAVIDPTKVKSDDTEGSDYFSASDTSALLAIIHLKI